jgi:hypothetical protein
MDLDFSKYSPLACLESCMNACIKKVKTYKYILGLFFLNFFTHYLFIFHYSFVSDDWSEIVYPIFSQYTVTNLILESQRPLLYVTGKVIVPIFGSYVLAYQILTLITTTLIIILVFLIAKSLFKHVFQDPRSNAFLVATFFCVIFNIDQLYAWGSMFAVNIAFVLYLSSFYFYINANQKQHYLFLSIFTFLIALFFYELGIFLPLICLFYDLIFNRDWKKSLLYVLPLGIYGIIRVTHWFGFGWVYMNRDQIFYSSQFLHEFSQNFLHNIVQEIALTGFNIFYGISGLLNLNDVVLFILIVFDGLCIFFIIKYLVIPGFSRECEQYNLKNAVKLLFIGIVGIILTHTVISLHGLADTRHLIFIDFFIFLIIVAFVGPVLAKKSATTPLFCIIVACVLISQGLSVNWIIAGDICSSVNQSIFENSKNISQYNYVFVNGTDLLKATPYAGPKYNFQNGQYNLYLNSPCLPDYSIISMLSRGGTNITGVHLIYGNTLDGNSTNVILVSNNGSIIFYDVTTKTYHSINRTEYFEFNSTNLLDHYYVNERSDVLFSR